MCMVTIAMIN